MYNLFITLIIIASILLVLLVLIQNSKGGGLAADFASGNQAVGVHKSDVREKQQEGQSAISNQVQDAAAEQEAATATPEFGE